MLRRLGVISWLLLITASGDSFPIEGLLPKAETGVLRILEKHPEFDGRGIKVAVFDSGVDPSVEGLQTTTTGEAKIIDLVDATGSGDVPMEPVTSIVEGKVMGLTGRLLELPDNVAASKEVRIGLKAAWELFPSVLVTRLKDERREVFVRKHQSLLVATRNEATLSQDERAARLQALGDAIDSYRDPGPVFDCVVYHDGERWRALVDTDEDGDLKEEISLTNYQYERQHASFGDQTQLNFTVNIYDEGKTLAIVVPANMHATHVAGIIGGYYKESPELNGLAPGVQIVSIKIGDSRLDGMETGSAVIRGLEVARAHGCQLINMSYGEPTRLPNQGRILALIDELVHEHNITFVSSAGNAGPALSTVGAPGGATSSVIGVGAYVTPSMARAGYAVRRPPPDMAYTWSSRGPATDGDNGVSICAPGGAFAPVPNYTLRRNRHANGTSMSSPNACGSLAVLLTALKHENLSHSPHLLKRVIENTAEALEGEDRFAQGHGLLRVDQALEHFRTHALSSSPIIDISIPSRQHARGLYLREAHDHQHRQTVSVSVSPRFAKKDPNADKLRFNQRFRLESTVPWLECPDHLFLTNRPSTFDVEIDPALMPPGAYAGEIQAFAEDHLDAGPAFHLPATLIRPEGCEQSLTDSDTLNAGDIERRFLQPPSGATWVDVTLTNRSAQAQTIILHAVQILPQRRHLESSYQSQIVAQPGIPTNSRIEISPTRTLELTLASNWSNQSAMDYELELNFQGLQANTDTRTLSDAEPIVRFDVHALQNHTILDPQATLTHWQAEIPPQRAVIHALAGSRDRLPNGHQVHEATVTYSFTLTNDANVLPRSPSMNERLYEADIRSQLYTITDANGQLLTTDDGWEPSAIHLKKGIYEVTYTWRHEDPTLLDPLTQRPLMLQGSLSSSSGLSVHANRLDAVHQGAQFRSQALLAGESRAVHIALPKAFKPNLPIAAARLLGHVKLHPAESDPAIQLIHSLPFPQSASSPHPNADSSDTKWQALRDKDTVKQRKEDHRVIVTLCDEIIAEIDQQALAQHRGQRPTEDSVVNQRFERDFKRLTDALYRKCRAIAYHDGEHEKAGEAFDPAPFDVAFAALQRWVDTKDADYILTHIRWQRRHGEYGTALNLLNKHMKSAAPTRLLHNKRVKILRELGWDLWADHEEQWNRRRFVPFLEATSDTDK